MGNIQKRPDARDRRYFKLVTARLHGGEDSEVAAKLHLNSAEELYQKLKEDGYPICPVCGTLHVGEGHCKTRETIRERQPRTLGKKFEELPSFANAAPYFRDTIRTLEVYFEHITGLNMDLEDLEHANSLKETLRGGLFIGEGETEEDYVREARGGQWHPHPYLVVLIGAYILEHCVYASKRGDDWGSVIQLLNKLHLRPSEANRKKLADLLYGRQRLKGGKLANEGDGFLNRARQIAALVRGVDELGSGAKNAALSPLDQWWVWYIESLVEQGLSREEILKKERDELEHYKLKTEESVLEELERHKRTLGKDEFARESHEAHRYLQHLAAETVDEDEFNRRWDLYTDSK
jgi:hypothetical protein